MVNKIYPSCYEVPEGLRRLMLKKPSLFRFADILFSLFITCPLVVTNWAFYWEFFDVFGVSIKSHLITGALSLGILSLLCERQFSLKAIAPPDNRIAPAAISKVYTMIVVLCSIMSWRAIWATMDHYIGTELEDCIWSMVLGLAILLPLGALKTSGLCVPFQSVSDERSRVDCAVFDFPSKFKAENSFIKRLLDALISAAVTTIGVLGVWRAMWIPQDILFVFQEDKLDTLSNGVSCFAGWISALILVVMQEPLDKVLKDIESRYGWWWRFSIETLYSLVQSASTILLWRGLWNYGLIHVDQLLDEIPPLYRRLIMALATSNVLIMLDLNSNACAKGCLLDGYGIGNSIGFLVKPEEADVNRDDE